MSFVAFAPCRSGQHAVGHWICRGHDRFPWWWNDVKWGGYYPEGGRDPEIDGFDPKVHRVGYDPSIAKANDGDRSNPYVSVESRRSIDYDYVINHMKEEFKSPPKRVLILRDVKGTAASSEAMTPPGVGDFLAVWEAHARRWLEDDEGIIRISFNRRLVDDGYRQELAEMLEMDSCPPPPKKGVNQSSFHDPKTYHPTVDTQAILNRGDLVKTEIPDRLLEMSKEIFG